jgi:hypothetical protein
VAAEGGSGDCAVFLSYRRSDSAEAAGRLYDHLEQRLGRRGVFKDVDSIPFGEDFRAYIEERIRTCRAVLVLIGEGWLTAENQAGRRLDDPADYVRMEIAAALRAGCDVIPVLVGGATMPAAEELPDDIRELCAFNAAKLRPDPDFRVDVRRILSSLEVPDEEPDDDVSIGVAVGKSSASAWLRLGQVISILFVVGGIGLGGFYGVRCSVKYSKPAVRRAGGVLAIFAAAVAVKKSYDQATRRAESQPEFEPPPFDFIPLPEDIPKLPSNAGSSAEEKARLLMDVVRYGEGAADGGLDAAAVTR